MMNLNSSFRTDNEKDFPIELIPRNAKTLIVIPGQCATEDHKPHELLFQRCERACQFYNDLIKKFKHDPETIYFIGTGNDMQFQKSLQIK